MTELCTCLDQVPKGSRTVILLYGADGWTTNRLNLPRFHLRYHHLNLQFVVWFPAREQLGTTYTEASGEFYERYSPNHLVEAVTNGKGDEAVLELLYFWSTLNTA